MNNSIFGHLESSLNGYLGDLTRRGETADSATALRIANSELPRVVAALQGVLDEHKPDDQGRCPSCRKRVFGHAPAPCRAYLAAHLCLLVTEDDQPYDSNTPGLSTR
ncbi:hypothetical protein [Actinocrispum wychmicini]|uniref:Uncharacterized protein n=1 Tax=Actinocrispum wychmicini TaxID=1213861 RepID=A0A4R2JDI0_9PSEU|nr:hypothetical protein [Actinocrispum wychmicini]TCO56567.1 hypothetical protein EV192_10640 [Actinocrispum wychmicini]